jgi:Toprim domain-containing protein
MNALTWRDVENITKGQIGRTVSGTCPFCSHTRKQANQRKRVFAIKLKDEGFAVFNCAHCGESGYVHSDSTARVVDLAEARRRIAEAARKETEDKAQRTAAALALWNERQSFVGSKAETYLRETRGLGAWVEAFDLDQSLGFHPSCPFGNERLPCMLALVRGIRSDKPQAIHRTALTGEAKPQRIDRLSLGPVAGGAVKLSLDGDVTHGLLIGEGIETVLSASLMLKFRPAWSVLSRSGIARFPVLSGVECVTIAVDNDESGDGQRDAATLVERLTAAGVEVITVQTNLAQDFNDVLVRAAK